MNVLNHRLEPKVMSLKEVLSNFLKHRYVILDRKSRYDLNKINLRLEILKGFLIVFKHLNNIIKTIRNSNNPKSELMKKYRFSENQVNAILDMKLRSLRKIEQKEIEDENNKLVSNKKFLTKLLASKALQKKEIDREIDEVIFAFGEKSSYGPRKTLIEKFNQMDPDELIEELKSNDPISVVISNNGFLKARIGYSQYKSSRDFAVYEQIIVNGKKSDKFIFLSSFGKSYTIDGDSFIFGLPKGRPFSSYFTLTDNEQIIDVFY